MSGQTITFEQFSSLHRYTGIFNDPNNAAVIFVAIMATLILNSHLSTYQAITVILIVLLIVISTMSTTGLISFSLILAIYIIKKSWGLAKPNFVKKDFIKSTLFFIFTMMIILLFLKSDYKIDSEVIDTAIQRASNNSPDSRLTKWETLLDNFQLSYFIIGNGGTIFINDNEASAHNGHIFLLFCYGLIPYLIFMYVFFRKRKHTTKIAFLCIVPLFLGFSVNVGIYDLRFALIFSLLMALYSSQNKIKY